MDSQSLVLKLLLSGLLVVVGSVITMMAYVGFAAAREFVQTQHVLALANETLALSNSAGCAKEEDHFACLERYYRALVTARGVPSAFVDLAALYNEDVFVKTQCHQLVHVIGRAAFEQYPSVAEAFLNGDTLCWSGYYHGVMEAIAADVGLEYLADHLDDICSEVPPDIAGWRTYFYCVHGLGHGVMAIVEGELFDALALCERMNGSWEQESCMGGVYMENIMRDATGGFTRYLDHDRLLYPCTDVADRNKKLCYLNHSTYVLDLLDGDFAKAFETCSGAGSEFAPFCYESLGRDSAAYGKEDVESIVARCKEGATSEQQARCIMGAVDFLSTYEPEAFVREFCAAAEDELHATCIVRSEEYFGQW